MNFFTIARFIIFLILIHFKLIASGANYYWVGGSGKWSDYSIHWATSSGGSSFHPQVPTNLDNVYFDQNSGFVAGNNTVTIDQTIIYCKDMDWTGAVGNPVLTTTLNSNVIKIFGSVKFISSMKFSFTGTVSFESTSTGNTITSSGQTILGDVLFNGSAGSWTLNDSLTVSNGITHNLGLLNTNNQTLSAATFYSTSANTRSLNFGSSLIKIYGHPNVSSGVFQLWDQNLTLNGGTSTIQFFGQGGRLIIQWGLTLYNVKTSNLGNFEFNAGGNFHKIEMNSDGLINVSGTLTLDSLILSPGKTYDISGAIQINAGGNLIAKGQCKEQITIRGKSQYIGYLNTPSGTVTNIEYCILKDFNAIGSGIFNAVNSYSLGNTNNWNITNPVGRTFYWIGGGGNWNDSQHWSLTSGGNADAGCTPTLGDNVVFDQNAGFTSTNKNVLINTTYAFSNDLTWTNAPNHPVFQLSNSSTLMVNGSFTLMKDMDLVFTGNLTFCATTSGPTITSASKVFNLTYLIFQGNGGVWNLTDSLTTTPATTLNLLMGTLNSNNQNITAGNFTNYSKLLSSGKSQLNLGSSTMRLTGPSFAWHCYYDYPNGMILTLNAGTSTIIFQNNNQSQSLKSEGQTFYNVLSTNPVSIDINGENNIFHKLEIRSDFVILGSAQYDSLILNPGSINRFKGASTQTIINGTLVANGSCSSPIYIECYDAGKTFTFIKTSGSVNVNYAILKDANATGGASFIANNSFAATPLTGWTINNLVGRNLFWVGGGGSWNDAAHWSLTSGGSGGQCIPSPMDNVYFDAKSGFGNYSSSAKTVMLSGERFFCKDMDWTGAINSPRLDGQGSLEIYGSLTFIPNMTANYYGSFLFAATSTANIHTANQKLNKVIFDSDSGIWNLTDDLIIDYGDLDMNRGKLITNDKNITLNNGSLRSYSTGTPELVLGKSVINILIGYIIINSTGFKLTPGQSTIILNTPSFLYSIYCTPGKTFYNVISKNNVSPLDIHGDNTFNKLTLMAGATFYDNNTFDTLNLTPGRTYKLKAGTTQSITTNGLLNAIGTPGFPIEIISLTAGSTAKIYKQQGKVCLDYLFLKDITAYGGASFYAGQYGANVSNNSGWIFGPCPNPPNITTQPQNVLMCYDYNLTTLVTFSITATNATSYQWQLDDGTGYKTIPNNGAYNGITTSSLSFYPNSISMSGYKYRVIVQGSGTSVTSFDATLTLYPSMSINQFAPTTLYVCEGTTPVIGYNVSNASSFQWQMYVSGGWENLTDSPSFSGTTTSTLTINNVPSQFNLTTFRLLILSQCNAPFTTPSTLLTITSPPAITQQPSDVTLLCPGGTATFSIKANSANTYQWQENNGNGFQNISNSAGYSGATSTTLTISNATAQMSGYQYRALAQGCSPDAMSNTVNLISAETEKPVFTFCPSDTTIVAGVYSYSAPTATDNCSQVTITQVSGLPSGSIFPVGITKQVFNASDLSGNVQTCTFNITATPVISSVTAFDKNAFNIYPNPTTDFVNVHFNFNVQDEIEMTITDYSGKKIRSSTIENNENEIKIDLRDLPKGIYYLQIQSDERKTVQMIMIR